MSDFYKQTEREPLEEYIRRTLKEAAQRAADEIEPEQLTLRNVESVRSRWAARVKELHQKELRRR